MTRDLEKWILTLSKTTSFVAYFNGHPERLPVKIKFREDHVPFDEAFAKHRYLKSLNRRHREKIIRTQSWMLGKILRKFLNNKKDKNSGKKVNLGKKWDLI